MASRQTQNNILAKTSEAFDELLPFDFFPPHFPLFAFTHALCLKQAPAPSLPHHSLTLCSFLLPSIHHYLEFYLIVSCVYPLLESKFHRGRSLALGPTVVPLWDCFLSFWGWMNESGINASVRKPVHNAFHGLGTVMGARDVKKHEAHLHLQGSLC